MARLHEGLFNLPFFARGASVNAQNMVDASACACDGLLPVQQQKKVQHSDSRLSLEGTTSVKLSLKVKEPLKIAAKDPCIEGFINTKTL